MGLCFRKIKFDVPKITKKILLEAVGPQKHDNTYFNKIQTETIEIFATGANVSM